MYLKAVALSLLSATAVFSMQDRCHPHPINHGWELYAYGDRNCQLPPASSNYFNGTLPNENYSRCHLFYGGVKKNLRSFVFNAASSAYML
ncbi:hypothetical protein BJ138DRAFT_1149104, partial [Hygrophoropsis aurantiaca]